MGLGDVQHGGLVIDDQVDGEADVGGVGGAQVEVVSLELVEINQVSLFTKWF